MMGSKLDCPLSPDPGTEGSHPDRLPSCGYIQCASVLEAVDKIPEHLDKIQERWNPGKLLDSL